MTTETEPMVRVLSIRCLECGQVYSEETPGLNQWKWPAEGWSALEVRERTELNHICDGGHVSRMLYATEPVR